MSKNSTTMRKTTGMVSEDILKEAVLNKFLVVKDNLPKSVKGRFTYRKRINTDGSEEFEGEFTLDKIG